MPRSGVRMTYGYDDDDPAPRARNRAGGGDGFRNAPFVRGAHAAGKLSVAFWDHWVPGANDVLDKLCQEWADEGKGRRHDRFRHQPGRQADADGRRGRRRPAPGTTSIGQPSWYARGEGGHVGTGRRSDGDVDRQIRQAERRGRISRQAERPLDRGAVDPEHADPALGRAHRPVQASMSGST